MRKSKKRLLANWIATLLVAGSVGSNISTADADTVPSGSDGRGSFIDPDGFGLSYGDWSARWWEWLLSIPAATNPNLSTGRVDCSVGQAGDVWFLAGSFGGTAQRSCTIPQGKALFFPMINTIVYMPGEKETLNDLRQQAAAFVDKTNLASLTCTIDGAPCALDLKRTRATSPTFSIIPPQDGLIPPDALKPRPEIVSDGYWIKLKPLPARAAPYVVRFGGASGSVKVDVTYRLYVNR